MKGAPTAVRTGPLIKVLRSLPVVLAEGNIAKSTERGKMTIPVASPCNIINHKIDLRLRMPLIVELMTPAS